MWVEAVHRWFEVNRPLVLFVSGQVFFVMGMAILLQTRRYSRLALARGMPWLAAFGILHGLYQWGSLFGRWHQAHGPESVNTIFDALQLLLLAASFAALFQFGVRLLQPFPPKLRWSGALPLVLLLVWLVGPFYLGLALGSDVHQWRTSAEIWARYGLGFPGAVVAAMGLRRQAKLRLLPLEFPSIYNLLRVAGVALLGYAVLGGLVVPKASFWPASVLNAQAFERMLVAPVEVFQGADGLVLAIAVILGLDVFEFETQRLIERMEQAQVVAIERERIARDLHDGAIQRVYAAGLLAQSLQRQAKDPAMQEGLAHLMEGINAAIAELRRFLSELREQETLYLGPALESLVEEARRISGTEIYLEVDEVPPMSPEATAHVISFAREALSNAIRHARSPLIEVRLSYVPARRRMRLEVKDHGVGLPEDPDMGYGLRNMRDRARLLGGTLSLVSEHGKGTRAVLDVPLDNIVRKERG